MWDPEKTAHTWGVPVYTVTLPNNLAGITDGRQVWVDHRLTTVERRCTIGHELVHVWAGHTSHQPPKTERWVRQHAANLLLREQDVHSALRTEPTLWDAADRLSLTVPVLTDHLERTTTWNCSSA